MLSSLFSVPVQSSSLVIAHNHLLLRPNLHVRDALNPFSYSLHHTLVHWAAILVFSVLYVHILGVVERPAESCEALPKTLLDTNEPELGMFTGELLQIGPEILQRGETRSVDSRDHREIEDDDVDREWFFDDTGLLSHLPDLAFAGDGPATVDRVLHLV